MFFMSRGAPERFREFTKKHVFCCCSVCWVLGHALAAPGARPGSACILHFRHDLLSIMLISACWTHSGSMEAAKATKKQENQRGTQISWKMLKNIGQKSEEMLILLSKFNGFWRIADSRKKLIFLLIFRSWGPPMSWIGHTYQGFRMFSKSAGS